uniref:NADH-ubiquinone oxidoreductase chain 2 n=1 Tax=Sophonia unicolor TaxID=3237925 RepID=A0AB39A589_9HEMI
MKINCTIILFVFSMMVGIMVTLSSNSILMMWVGLELTMISFIPLMTVDDSSGGESSMKYFIIQSVSSCMLVMSILLMLMLMITDYMMVMSLCIKVGLAPFHSWILSMVDGLSYLMTFMLLSIMKISPIFILSFTNFNFMLLIMITLIIGSVSGLNQNSVRKLMSYSSIYNLGFVFSGVYLNSIWSVYLIVYSLILMVIIYLLMNLNVNYLNQFIFNGFNMKEKMNLWICMLSLGGMPPTLGFFNKIIIFETMIMYDEYVLLMVMLLSSLLVMFFYTRMSLISMMISSLCMKWNIYLSSNTSYMLLVLNLLMFPLFILMKSII